MVWESIGVSEYLFGPVVFSDRQVIARCCDFLVIEEINLERGTKYPLYLLVKERQDTLNLLADIRKKLKCRQIGYCGLKDKYGLTIQYLTLDKCRIMPEILFLRNALLKRIGHVDVMLNQGMNIGNIFYINVRHADMRVLRNFLVNTSGSLYFPNYVGYQRFGIKKPYTHELGFVFLKFIIGEEKEFLNIVSNKRGWWEKQFNRRKVIDKQIKNLLVQAVQSFYFNLCLSRMISENKMQINPMKSGLLIGYDLFHVKHPPWIEKMHLECVQEQIRNDEWMLSALKNLGVRTRYRPLLSIAKFFLIKERKQGLLIGFKLGPGTYGTVVLRELVGDKGSIITSCDKCLNSS